MQFFTGSTFVTWADPEDGIAADADFEYASFKFADFRSVRFERPASFGLAKFAEPALFRRDDKLDAALFTSTADFTGVSAPHCDFSGVTFQGGLKMPLLNVPGLATFAAATFSDQSDFTQANLGCAVFVGATFAQTADFEGARFGSAEFWTRTKRTIQRRLTRFVSQAVSSPAFTSTPTRLADKQYPLDFQPILRLEKGLQERW